MCVDGVSVREGGREGKGRADESPSLPPLSPSRTGILSPHLKHPRHALHLRVVFIEVYGECVVRRLIRPQLTPEPDDREELVRIWAAKKCHGQRSVGRWAGAGQGTRT